MALKRFFPYSVFFILFYLLSCAITIHAQTGNIKQTKPSSAFTENKGQIIDQSGRVVPDVRFLLNRPGINVQLRTSGFSYDCYHFKSESSIMEVFSPSNDRFKKDSSVIQYNRIDINLLHANPSPGIIKLDPSKDYTNYYNEVTENGILQVRSYSHVLYKNIYPHIDLEFYLNAQGNCKYQFLIHPGGNPADIQLSYSGVDVGYILNSQLVLKYGNDSLVEKIPVSYVLESGEKVAVDFLELEPGVFGFKVAAYTGKETLVIDPDPAIQWSTYYGGTDMEDVFHVTKLAGFIYVSGWTWSTGNIATSGAHQVTHVQWHDGFICKLDAAGNRVWGTYYGGTGEDVCSSIATDQQYLYISGYTEAPSGISTPGSHQPVFGGIQDAMLLKFDTTGVRVWGTYYGGTGDDGALGIVCKGTYLYFTGATESSTVFASTGCHQPLYAGSEDAFLAKFTTNGTRVWSTYYGGGADENGINVDCSGNTVCLIGWTYSGSQLATPGAHQPLGGGNADAFLVKFDTNGVRQWGTYYGGANSDDGRDVLLYGNDIFITGLTSSNNNIADSTAYQPVKSGTDDCFIAKFSTTGQKIWGTYYGGTSIDQGYCIDEAAGDLFIAGETRSLNAIASANAYQPVFGGGSNDGLLARFDTTGHRVWGSYFGGALLDRVYALYVDSTSLVIGGVTASASGISTPGAFQSTMGGSTDGYIASMYEPCQFMSLSLTAVPDTGLCNGSINSEVNGGAMPYDYSWSSGDTTAQLSGLCSGWYYVTVTDSNQCLLSDSVFVSSPNGIINPDLAYSFSLFPNPSANEITVLLETDSNPVSANYLITDVLGQAVQSGYLVNSFSKINTLSLPSGYYTFSVVSGRKVMSQALVICR